MLSGDSASVFLYYNILVNFSFYSEYYFKRHQLQRVCVCVVLIGARAWPLFVMFVFFRV